MANTPNGAISPWKELEWLSEYDTLLDGIASTDFVDTEWPRLRDVVKYKIHHNVCQYLAGDSSKGETNTKTPERIPRSSPISLLSSSSPSPFATSNVSTSVHQGLVIPPFPKRERRKDTPMRMFNSTMDETEADEFKTQVYEQLDEFDNAPFTIQRISELCIHPRKHYKTVGKYLRALERTILVTSNKEAYPSIVGDGAPDMAPAYDDNESLRLATTPVFSPIPFLHDDARRSRSPSPFELTATRRSLGASGDVPSMDPLSGRQPLGLVDELDDPKPGHLADHPTALTAVTSTGPAPALPSLNERFVRSSSPESEDGSRDTSETVELRQAEDAEVEDMVLDDSTLEDEDKENRPS